MANTKIRRANKKAKHELHRTRKRQDLATRRHNNRVSQKRARKMMVQGRREHLKKRRAEKNYVANLEAEIDG